MRPRIEIHEQIKVPVFKNIAYALKMTWKADKSILISYIIQETLYDIFQMYIQNILFLKVLLTVIEGNGTFQTYVKYLLIFLAISVFVKFTVCVCDYISHVAQKRILKSMNNMIFEKAGQVDVSCYEDPAFYDKFQRATTVVDNDYFVVLAENVATVIGSILSFAFVVTTVTIINPTYLIFLAPVLLTFVVETAKSKIIFKRELEMTKNNRIKGYTQRTMFLKDYSKDMRTSNIFAVLIQRFNNAIRENIHIIKNYGLKLFLFSMLSSLFGELIPIVCTYGYAGYEFINTDTMKISSFSVVLSSIDSVSGFAWGIAQGFRDMTQMALYFQNLHDFFDYQPKILSGDKIADKFESVEFKNVSFKYPSADKYSLENVNLKINKGETVAIVGVNGAGKSTLVKLLLRFYDVDEGEILYNGINIKEYEVESLRNSFATVFQDYKNFAVSIYENVICHECSDEEKLLAQKALKQSGVWDKIQSLENGGETVLTKEFDKNGAGLSGGENQKVSTARLFAKDFDIAILDEPSSALDPVAEYEMYENLISATKDKTVVYISHRLSSAVLSDKIFVLGNGTVIENGTHSELVNADGEYAKMFALQAKSYREESDDNE